MDDITLNLIVIACFALIGSAIFLLVRRKQSERVQAIHRMAAEYGWTSENIREPLAWGLRLKSKRWMLEALSRSNGRETAPGSTDIAMTTIWRADAPGSTLLIGTRTSQANLGELGDALAHHVLQMALGAHANGLTELQVGSKAFQKKYRVWAQDPIEAGRLLTPDLESALLNWKGASPFIKRTTEGLTIELHGVRLQKADEIRSLVRIGELIIANDI